MYVKKAKIGGFIYPQSYDVIGMLEKEIGHLNGYSGVVKKWNLPIPVGSLDFNEFCESIQQSEKEIKEIIKANDEVFINI